MCAGAAQIDISPSIGTQISGAIGMRRPTRLILDPIYAKALVLEKGNRRICIVSLDVPTAAPECATHIRTRAAEQFGFDPAAILICCTQTHAAPCLGHQMSGDSPYIPPELSWMRSGDDAYTEFALERILKAIETASQRLRPACVGIGSGTEGRIAFNRRVVYRNGTAHCLQVKAGDPEILYVEGPIDPELGVIAVVGPDARPLALLLHHTCHPCHGNGKHYITAGWPGAWAGEMRRIFGEQCVSLVINGCCGNIHHRNRLDRDPHHSDNFHRLGRILSETTLEVLKNRMVYIDDPILDWGTDHLKLAYRQLEPDRLEEARRLLEEHPEPIWMDKEKTAAEWKWCYAVANLQLAQTRKRDTTFDYEIQAFRIGNSALLALGGEPFVEAQLQIKECSPAWRTFIAHMANGCFGYIPTQRAFARGGYETWTTLSSKLARDSLDRIVTRSRELIGKLFVEAEGGGK